MFYRSMWQLDRERESYFKIRKKRTKYEYEIYKYTCTSYIRNIYFIVYPDIPLVVV